MLPPLGAHTPASKIFRISSFGTASGFNRRIDRMVRMISNRSAAFADSSDNDISSRLLASVYISVETEFRWSAIMPEAPTIDFWLSMGSTYTYLTVTRPRPSRILLYEKECQLRSLEPGSA